MNRSRLADVARGATAVVALLALVAGPPIALASAVGWPLPTSLPTITAIEDAARSGVSDDLVVKVLAAIAWIAWLQVAAAVVCEVVALLRRSPTLHLPVLPGLQPVVAKLAAAALLLATSASSRVPHATAQPAAAPPTDPPPAAATTALPEVAAPPAVAAAPAVVTIAVERHDSYWAIAERTLGDGFRWREIRDANVGRTMPDGHVIAPGSDLVRPGWSLEVPVTPPAPDPPPAPLLVPTATVVTVEAGDGFWAIAEEQVEAQLGHAATDDQIRPYWEALIDANHDQLADPANPNLLFTGQHLALVGPPAAARPEATPVPTPVPSPAPATGAPQEEPEPVTTLPPSTIPATTAPPAGEQAPAERSEQPSVDPEGTESPVTEMVAAGFSALLAVGAARNLARRRRRRAHLRLVADQPTGDADADVHRQILLSVDSAAIDSLEAGLIHLAGSLRDTQVRTTPVIVQHGDGHLDVYVDPPASPPTGWTSADESGAVWTADPTVGPAQTDAGSACPAPLLVTLGQPDDGGQLYLDLEAARIVALTGDPAVARDIARTMVTDLALSPLAATIDIVVIGDLGGNIAQLDHVRCLDDWSDIADDLDAWTTQTHDALVANGWPNPFIARAIDPDHDGLAPLAVIATEPAPADLLARLAETGPCVAGVVVTGNDIAGAMQIDCRPDRIALPSIGLEATPHPLEVASLDEIVALLDDPLDEAGDPSEPTLFDAADAHEPEPPGLLGPDVLVRVLGEITVDGDHNLTAKQTAVLAFIALHGTVTAERVENAVWAAPSSSSRRKRLSNTVSEIRAAIGREHFPTGVDGRYTTGAGVTTDAHLFDHLVRQAAGEAPAAACATLRAALDVVSGPVFTYRDVDRASYTWVDLENLVSTWELRIAAVAERCADLYIDIGQPNDAAEVANRALTLIPTHTGITEVLMRAHAANGDRLAVQRVFQAHASALEQLDLDDVAESTSELYASLSQRSG
jgi:DNA-binding SARP family transcriptional activator